MTVNSFEHVKKRIKLLMKQGNFLRARSILEGDIGSVTTLSACT